MVVPARLATSTLPAELAGALDVCTLMLICSVDLLADELICNGICFKNCSQKLVRSIVVAANDFIKHKIVKAISCYL